nr:MAG TPA: hypothetical protein [Caudoviricetes sp.]
MLNSVQGCNLGKAGARNCLGVFFYCSGNSLMFRAS